MHTGRWESAWLDPAEKGGWAVAHYRQQFLGDANGVLFPRDWLKRQDLPVLSEQGVGHFDGDAVYLLELESPASVEGCSWIGLRHVMLEAEEDQFAMLGFASQVGTWARENRFCGGCGQPMRAVPRERAMRCDACDIQRYPLLSPSMIVLVTRGDELLLARSPRFVPGMYSTLAGFVEPGESVEHCVAREVKEEVGLQVGNIRYLGSQNWPFPHSLMLGFHAEYVSGEIVCQPDEIEDAQWFPYDSLPRLPAGRSIARYLIESWLARRAGRPDPILPGGGY
ncbi:NAD(+) diphosphatase [Pseudomonas citronellolis]|uniref:NAD-capped RNA hydrolase NudC n=1 Tax=Pseudomonas citronellolis TaxID=53408 RepID=A0AAW6P0B6_9PSED|nr:NAD(+) diphosphatase [Pseudomonas citronellolis]MDF3840808.1 NAD(+) diphosphatase [Pseudomonas citronellolis]